MAYSSFELQVLFCLNFLQLTLLQHLAWGHDALTKGFAQLPFNHSYYHVQRPYDVPLRERYSHFDGVHKCWVYSIDKPHTSTSKTLPPTEIAIQGYGYDSGVWEFEANGYVPCGTSGVSILQVFGAAAPHATTLMLRVYNGLLMYYRRQVLVQNIGKLNVIHDVDAARVKVYIDGCLKLEADGRGGTSHAFKAGVYAQGNASCYMESRWKHIKVLRKCEH